MQFGRRKPIIQKESDDGPFFVTAEGLERLHTYLDRLKQSLPHLISEAERTAAYGDRSENDEYKHAKALLRRTHRQISTAEHRINRASVIPSGPSASGAIRLGSTVVLDAGGGKQKTFLILGPHEADPAKGRISDRSPLGTVLMGRRQGETVTVKTENGAQEYGILEVR